MCFGEPVPGAGFRGMRLRCRSCTARGCCQGCCRLAGSAAPRHQARASLTRQVVVRASANAARARLLAQHRDNAGAEKAGHGGITPGCRCSNAVSGTRQRRTRRTRKMTAAAATTRRRTTLTKLGPRRRAAARRTARRPVRPSMRMDARGVGGSIVSGVPLRRRVLSSDRDGGENREQTTRATTTSRRARWRATYASYGSVRRRARTVGRG